jgi:hypothetical protein
LSWLSQVRWQSAKKKRISTHNACYSETWI